MESLIAPKHKEHILTALSQVPLATTKQLSTLNQSLDPQKKASAILRELEKEKLVKSMFHGREKVWRRYPTRLTNLNHALAVGQLYFTCKPKYWLYEPREKFTHEGHKLEWRPDCIITYQKKLYAVEVQLSLPPGKGTWSRKWRIYNLYFNHGYYETAEYQKWAAGRNLLPQFMVITKQNPETVKQGFEVKGRELIVVKSM